MSGGSFAWTPRSTDMRGPDLFFLTFFTMIGFVVWVVVGGWLRRLRLKTTAEFQTKLLDRISSLSDLNEFLQTEGGKKVMEGLTFELPSVRPHESLLRTIQLGIILLALGVGFLVLRVYFGARYAIGFLLSAAVSYRLAGKLGVLDRGRGRLPSDVRP
jgi:hypothetical protein